MCVFLFFILFFGGLSSLRGAFSLFLGVACHYGDLISSSFFFEIFLKVAQDERFDVHNIIINVSFVQGRSLPLVWLKGGAIFGLFSATFCYFGVSQLGW